MFTRALLFLIVAVGFAVPAPAVATDMQARGARAENVEATRDSRGRIKRSAVAKNAFKRAHPCPTTRATRGPCPGYVIDQIIALKRGGADAPNNMQWQPIAEARAKDRIE